MINILIKDEQTAVYALDDYGDHSRLGLAETRMQGSRAKNFTNFFEAVTQEEFAINLSLERGWRLVYTGERNYG